MNVSNFFPTPFSIFLLKWNFKEENKTILFANY